MTMAPIVLFTYNRPWHSKQVLDALAENAEAKDSFLYIFCDGPKQNASDDLLQKIDSVKKLANSENRFKQIKVIEQSTNKGLATSIINGVSEVLQEHDRIIVLEDDIVASPGFLRYMNSALDMYENEEDVGCIHAWNYHLATIGYNESTFFLKGADCWGWATWARSWNLFNPDGLKLLEEINSKGLSFEFNRRGTHPFTNMLREQIEGKNDSWAIRWHASLFLAGKYCLHPVRPMAKNIGLDNSGVHSGEHFIKQEPSTFITLRPIDVREDDWFFNAYENHQKKNQFAVNLQWRNIKQRLKQLFRH